MKTLLLSLALLSAGCVHAQQTFNLVYMKKPNAAASTPRIDFYENTNTYAVRVRANGTALTSSLNFVLPYIADTSGDCLISGGSGVWNPGACVPSTLSLSGTITSTAGNIISTSTGNAVLTATGGAFGDAYVRLNSNSSGQTWHLKSSGTSGNLIFRDNTAGVDYLTITKATGALSGAHIQSLGTGDSPTFNTITATVNSSLAIASATSLDVSSGNATIGSGGDIGTVSFINAAGAISSTGSFVRAHSSSGFRVGGTVGLSPGATQTLTMRDAAGTGTCTITVIGGIISATTC